MFAPWTVKAACSIGFVVLTCLPEVSFGEQDSGATQGVSQGVTSQNSVAGAASSAGSVDPVLVGLGQAVRVEDRVGEFIPGELSFLDDAGRTVKLSSFLGTGRAVVMTLNYSDCPGLCIAQLENLVETLRGTNAAGIGENYQIVTVSIDPREDSEKAARTKSKYLGLLRETSAEKHWHFLVGKQPEITALAKSVGYYYTYDKENDRFNHPAVLYFIGGNGRLCRYLVDLGVEPKQFQLAVAEANEGKLTKSLAEAFVQFCYTYDASRNRYSADAKRIMTIGFSTFAVLAVGFLAPFWFGKNKNRPNAAETHRGGSEGDRSGFDT